MLRAEHALLPRVVDAVADGRLALDADGRAVGAFVLAVDAPPFALATPGADLLSLDVDRALAVASPASS